MLASPDYILKENRDKSYEELLKVRDKLIRKIRKFEKNGLVCEEHKIGDDVWVDLVSSPSPKMRYERDLESLGLLCKLISEKHNEEYNAGITVKFEKMEMLPDDA